MDYGVSVSAAYWTVQGVNVTAALVDQHVTAHVIVEPLNEMVSGILTIRVREDTNLIPSSDIEVGYFTVTMNVGEREEYNVTFQPNKTSFRNPFFKGYFIQVEFNHVRIYTMEPDYPPRLQVPYSSGWIPVD